MLYVSSKELGVATVTDSRTGEKVIVAIEDEVVCISGNQYGIESVLGYCCGVLRVIQKELLVLLEYVDRVAYIGYDDEKSLRVCNFKVDVFSDYNIIVKTALGYYYSILDIIMCASYDKLFSDMLNGGVICCNFCGDGISIHFCGAYKGCVAKLISLYRGRWEALGKMQTWIGGRALI